MQRFRERALKSSSSPQHLNAVATWLLCRCPARLRAPTPSSLLRDVLTSSSRHATMVTCPGWRRGRGMPNRACARPCGLTLSATARVLWAEKMDCVWEICLCEESALRELPQDAQTICIAKHLHAARPAESESLQSGCSMQKWYCNDNSLSHSIVWKNKFFPLKNA